MKNNLRIIISVGLLAFLAWRTDWQQVGRAFATMQVHFWLAAVGLLITAQLVSAVRWLSLAIPLGLKRPLLRMIGFYFIGMYFNLVLPTSVGGDVVRAWYLDGNSGKKLPAFVSVFLDRLCGLWILISLACLGVIFSPLALPSWISWTVWGIAACAVLGMASMPVLSQHSDKAPNKIRRVFEALRALPNRKAWLVPVSLSVFIQLSNVLIVWLVGLSIGVDVPLAYFFVMVPMVSLLTMLPLSVNGMGVREGGMVVLLAPLGVASGVAVTLALLWFTVSAVVSLLGGLVYAFGHFPRPAVATVTQEEGVGDHGTIGGDSDQGREGQYQAAA